MISPLPPPEGMEWVPGVCPNKGSLCNCTGVCHGRWVEKGTVKHCDTCKCVAQDWNKILEEILEFRFDDGSLVIEYVLATNPELKKRLMAALDKAGR